MMTPVWMISLVLFGSVAERVDQRGITLKYEYNSLRRLD